jgi:hypothetical protein
MPKPPSVATEFLAVTNAQLSDVNGGRNALANILTGVTKEKATSKAKETLKKLGAKTGDAAMGAGGIIIGDYVNEANKGAKKALQESLEVAANSTKTS